MSNRTFCYDKSDSITDLTLVQKDKNGNEQQVAHGRLENVAQEIAMAKADAVCNAMMLFASARIRLGKTWTQSSITWGKARLQKTTATSPPSLSFQQEAAHLLPGNILINGKNSWDVIEALGNTSNLIRLSGELMEAFADTCSLPECFNKADSQAENGADGLKIEFAEAVSLMGRHLGWKVDNCNHLHSAVRIGLERWFLRSHEIYGDAAKRKAEKAKEATRPETRMARSLESRVLAEYSRSLLIRNPLRHIESSIALREVFRKTEDRVFGVV